MADFVSPAFLWFVAGVVLILLEFAIPGVLIVFFGAGAMMTALLSWAGLLQGALAQLLFFLVSSLALLFGLRRFVAGSFRGDTTQENDEDFKGKTARAVTDITPGSLDGRVAFQGTEWKAESQVAVARGESVTITGKKNITLAVEPLKQEGRL